MNARVTCVSVSKGIPVAHKHGCVFPDLQGTHAVGAEDLGGVKRDRLERFLRIQSVGNRRRGVVGQVAGVRGSGLACARDAVRHARAFQPGGKRVRFVEGRVATLRQAIHAADNHGCPGRLECVSAQRCVISAVEDHLQLVAVRERERRLNLGRIIGVHDPRQLAESVWAIASRRRFWASLGHARDPPDTDAFAQEARTTGEARSLLLRL